MNRAKGIVSDSNANNAGGPSVSLNLGVNTSKGSVTVKEGGPHNHNAHHGQHHGEHHQIHHHNSNHHHVGPGHHHLDHSKQGHKSMTNTRKNSIRESAKRRKNSQSVNRSSSGTIRIGDANAESSKSNLEINFDDDENFQTESQKSDTGLLPPPQCVGVVQAETRPYGSSLLRKDTEGPQDGVKSESMMIYSGVFEEAAPLGPAGNVLDSDDVIPPDFQAVELPKQKVSTSRRKSDSNNLNNSVSNTNNLNARGDSLSPGISSSLAANSAPPKAIHSTLTNQSLTQNTTGLGRYVRKDFVNPEDLDADDSVSNSLNSKSSSNLTEDNRILNNIKS